ncbi:hypothetical protein BpHYR1_009514 [Brachionus plicatilis]|uniref:Uncharacterized protein n=1 Tax=Brachionus plicatilis TaxID=10195 RepID=A0A3M7STY2_BRAPC|nr:hypothetical protein BpHYR1_009514 [Brachionus plicatilis]
MYTTIKIYVQSKPIIVTFKKIRLTILNNLYKLKNYKNPNKCFKQFARIRLFRDEINRSNSIFNLFISFARCCPSGSNSIAKYLTAAGTAKVQVSGAL